MCKIYLLLSDAHRQQDAIHELTALGFNATGLTMSTLSTLCPATEKTLLVLDADLPWRALSTQLETLSRHGIAVLFRADSMVHAAHLTALYHGLSSVFADSEERSLVHAIVDFAEACEDLQVYGSLCLNRRSRIASLGGKPLSLTAQEYALLEALLSNPGKPLARQWLLQNAWGYQETGTTRTVDVHVQRLRQKLGAAAIETVYRQGYRLVLCPEC